MEFTTTQDELTIVSDTQTFMTDVYFEDDYLFSLEEIFAEELHRELVKCLEERFVYEAIWHIYYENTE
jgi:hypothetical protein